MTFISPVYAADGVDISSLYNPAESLTGAKTIGDLLTGGPVNLINIIFILVGLFFFANLIMAGWDYMLSTGDPKKISAATTRLLNSFIGIIIALTAFVIVRLISQVLNLSGTGQPII